MWTFIPILKTTIWGGRRLPGFKGCANNSDCTIGESWEVSDVEGNVSVVAEGPDKGMTMTGLIERYGASLLGKENYRRFGNRFPLLLKYIDACDDLSVQVHPDDITAKGNGLPNGKTEMWYVVDAKEGSYLYSGFTRKIDPSEYENLVESGKIMDILNKHNIKKGDVFFIPGGRVHSIGKGAFIAEIQQTSDTTYRIYDYHRKGSDGKERKLHVKEALEAITFNDTRGEAVSYVSEEWKPVTLVTCPYFTTNLIETDRDMKLNLEGMDTFVIIMTLEGRAELECDGEIRVVTAGTTLLLPAKAQSLSIRPDGNFKSLEIYI